MFQNFGLIAIKIAVVVVVRCLCPLSHRRRQLLFTVLRPYTITKPQLSISHTVHTDSSYIRLTAIKIAVVVVVRCHPRHRRRYC